MLVTSLIAPKPDEDLKIITPWWEVLFKYITVVIMAIALTTIAVQAARDNPVCLPVVNCSATITSINSSAVNTAGDVCSKVPKNKLNSTTKTLTSFQKDALLHAFLNSACFESMGHSLFYPWALFLGAFVLVVANNIWIINPSASLTMKQFVSLVKECYELAIGTDQDIYNLLHKKPEVQRDKPIPDRSDHILWSDEVGEGVPLQDRHPSDEANTPNSSIELSESDVSQIISLNDKVQKFRDIHMKKSALSVFYIVQLILQIATSAAFLYLTHKYFFDFQLKFKCTLSDYEEVFPMHYDDIICLRYIVSFYRVITYYTVFPLFGFCILFSLLLFFVMTIKLCMPSKFIKNTTQLVQTSTVDQNFDIKRDLAFLCILLKSNQNNIQFDRFLLFVSKQ